MTDNEYKANMDILINGIKVFEQITQGITDEDIATMLSTLSRSEGVGFLFVAPVEFERTMKNVRHQKKILNLVKDFRSLLRQIKEEAFK